MEALASGPEVCLGYISRGWNTECENEVSFRPSFAQYVEGSGDGLHLSLDLLSFIAGQSFASRSPSLQSDIARRVDIIPQTEEGLPDLGC